MTAQYRNIWPLWLQIGQQFTLDETGAAGEYRLRDDATVSMLRLSNKISRHQRFQVATTRYQKSSGTGYPLLPEEPKEPISDSIPAQLSKSPEGYYGIQPQPSFVHICTYAYAWRK